MPEIGEAQALLEVLERDEAVKAESARREATWWSCKEPMVWP